MYKNNLIELLEIRKVHIPKRKDEIALNGMVTKVEKNMKCSYG